MDIQYITTQDVALWSSSCLAIAPEEQIKLHEGAPAGQLSDILGTSAYALMAAGSTCRVKQKARCALLSAAAC